MNLFKKSANEESGSTSNFVLDEKIYSAAVSAEMIPGHAMQVQVVQEQRLISQQTFARLKHNMCNNSYVELFAQHTVNLCFYIGIKTTISELTSQW